MEAMLSRMMEGCMKGMSEEDRNRMMAFCGKKMAAVCPCMGAKELTGEERKAMMEKIMGMMTGKPS